MAKQNLWSWSWDTSLPSPQIAGFLIKAAFQFLPALAFTVFTFEWQAAGPEFSSISTPERSFMLPSFLNVPFISVTLQYLYNILFIYV